MVKDHIRYLQKFRTDAAECKLISDLAMDKTKRELFARLADLLGVLASEVRHAIAKQTNSTVDPPAPAISEREDGALSDDNDERTEDAKRVVENYAARLRKLFKTLRRPLYRV